MQAVLARGGEDDLAGYELDMGSVIGTGGRILRLLTKVCSRYATGTTTAERLAAGWKTPHARLLDAALILCADHELNVSSFAARVIASTGATPYAVVAGALAALSGHKHGGHTRRVAVLLDEIEQYGDFNAVIRSRLARGDGIPGFEHRLYPDGDPRAAALLAMMSETVPEVADRLRVTESIIRHETGKLPNIDYALVTLERLLGLPQDAAFMLFAIGRSAGWIAHAIEQYARPELLRPRAKYVGAMPPI
jgi:citrate synthase